MAIGPVTRVKKKQLRGEQRRGIQSLPLRVVKAHRLCASLISRLESNKEEGLGLRVHGVGITADRYACKPSPDSIKSAVFRASSAAVPRRARI